MKKIFLILILFFGSINILNAEGNRIIAGNKDAKITIIAYESLTCSHCADFHKNVYPQLKKDYIDTGLVKIEFRHFPLDVAAFNASKISQCKSNESLKILNSLYSNQQAWVKGGNMEEINDNLKTFIKNQGFDLDFEKCINDKKIEDYVLNDRIEGTKKFKVNATPTIIINNKKFEKPLNYKNLKKSLEKLI
ncbi:thioredoxin domain-containing protein [Candidatus Pelagibacter sp.]|uniref:thioredoxin domain-containing protein n=1 Tax=Candidatus Pelagibacter sp. TaxID=2024849 RepID=UPI003F83FD84